MESSKPFLVDLNREYVRSRILLAAIRTARRDYLGSTGRLHLHYANRVYTANLDHLSENLTALGKRNLFPNPIGVDTCAIRFQFSPVLSLRRDSA